MSVNLRAQDRAVRTCRVGTDIRPLSLLWYARTLRLRKTVQLAATKARRSRAFARPLLTSAFLIQLPQIQFGRWIHQHGWIEIKTVGNNLSDSLQM